jgi:hypothetical protein
MVLSDSRGPAIGASHPNHSVPPLNKIGLLAQMSVALLGLIGLQCFALGDFSP